MNTRIAVLILCAIVFLASPVWADVVAEFTNGNDDTTYVDAYHGIAGDGWTSAWVENRNKGTSTTTVASTTEVYSGGGNYVSTLLTPGMGETDVRYALTREHGDLGGDTPRRIEFYFRLDEALGATFGDAAADRYQLFDGPAGANTGSAGSTWQIHGYSVAEGNCPAGCEKEWSFVNGSNSSSGTLSPSMAVNTDVPLIGGAVYYFRIDLHTDTGTWDGYVTSTVGGTTYSYDSKTAFPNGMGWRTNAVKGNWLYFSSRASSDSDQRAFSVDGIRIAELPPTPPPGDMDTVVARFTDGNTTTLVDGYPGMPGSGWRDAWQARASTGATVTATAVASGDAGYTELKPGQSGTYLKVAASHTADASYTGLTRSYKATDHGIDWSKKHSIQFSVRIDEDLGAGLFTHVDDRCQFSEVDNGFNNDESSTWTVSLFGGSDGVLANAEDVGVWTFYDGGRDGGDRTAERNVASNMAVISGAVYDFTIMMDPATQSYIGTVSRVGTAETFTTGTLGWRTDATAIGGWLCFDTRAGGVLFGDQRAFSLDEIVITQIEETVIPGDADGNGHVDQVDAAAVAAHWGTATGATWAMGDFNADGAVNAADASILAANWSPATEGASVPEPGVLALSVLGLVLLALRRGGK